VARHSACSLLDGGSSIRFEEVLLEIGRNCRPGIRRRMKEMSQASSFRLAEIDLNVGWGIGKALRAAEWQQLRRSGSHPGAEIQGKGDPRLGRIETLDSALRNRTRFILLDVGTIDGPTRESRRNYPLIRYFRLPIGFPLPLTLGIDWTNNEKPR
jgi:hypothetical protein